MLDVPVTDLGQMHQAILKVGDIVKVKVLDVDLKRKRISLTMKGLGNQTR